VAQIRGFGPRRGARFQRMRPFRRRPLRVADHLRPPPSHPLVRLVRLVVGRESRRKVELLSGRGWASTVRPVPKAARSEEPEETLRVAQGGAAECSVALPMFEGPLDLLLHLCQKHELNILDIPIAFVTEKYLEYLALMQLMNLDVASEYLLMAATLAHIKSKMLLPAPPPGQDDDVAAEEEDPREALIRRLLEYQKYKAAGADLAARGIAGRDVFYRGAPIEEAVDPGLPPLAEVPLFSLLEAFQAIVSRTKVKITHDVVADRISITDRIHELVDLLQGKRERCTFDELFDGLTTRFDLVITFLALLEMTRLRMTRLFQTEPLAPLYIELRSDTDAASIPIPSDVDAEPPRTDDARATAPAKPRAEGAEDDERTSDDDEDDDDGGDDEDDAGGADDEGTSDDDHDDDDDDGGLR
jgi:segregation and condensation protein A